MKQCLLLVYVLSAFVIVKGQVAYTDKPLSLQLYPRNPVNNTATVVTSGTITSPGIVLVKLEVYKNNVLVKTSSQSLAGNVNESFSFSETIIAELSNYKFVVSILFTNGVWVENYVADKVVAGDAIIIQGQSNAESALVQGSSAAYQNDFIRVYFSGSDVWFPPFIQWYIGQGDGYNGTVGNTGQWGLVLANYLVTQTNYPIAVFNGAQAASPISYFLRNNTVRSDLSTNYGRLLTRIQGTGFQNNIRAVFWYQGEANAQNLELDDINTYKTKFYALRNAWLEDYPGVNRFYISQIRYGCGQFQNTTVLIKEALRQIAVENADTRIYGTGALQHDADLCHFTFVNGYEKLGIDWSYIVKKDLYGGADLADIESPLVVSVSQINSREIQLKLKSPSDNISIQTGSLDDFHFEGASVQPVIQNAAISGNNIILTLDMIPPGTTGLSYYENHVIGAAPNIVNANNMALVNFYNMPVLSAVLPTRLVKFEARWNELKNIAFEWSIEEESDMLGYEIEYSRDGINFQFISMTAAINSLATQNYSSKYVLATSKENYFRLKLIARGGKISYSRIVRLTSLNNLKEMNVYPNPVTKKAFLNIHASVVGKARLQMTNIMGQEIKSLSVNLVQGENTIDLGTLISSKKGMYYIHVFMNNDMQTTKIIIQ
ncbi:MAG: T9SS type A sorting domain-containing protein [Chitinophagaceae bacterium]|nr:T9SS type A sorting domain-containing protein [Chitinophagaceae bacterium]